MGAAPTPDPTQGGGDPNAAPDPSQGGAPPPGGDPNAGSSGAPANPTQIMLAQMYQVCKKLAQQDPVLSSGMMKAAEGIQEAQTAMLTNSSPEPASSNPPL